MTIPSKVILDRYFVYGLSSYCSEMTGLSKEETKRKYGDLYNVLSYCLLFFDKILIEQHYVSSIAWNLNKKESKAFKALFENFSFSDTSMTPHEELLLKDSIESDINDTKFKKIISKYYSEKVIKPENYREIITYINNCIFYSEKNTTSICPLAKRTPLFDFKFNNLNRFKITQRAHEYTKAIIELLIPNLGHLSLNDLLEIKSNKTIIDFRKKIWELASDNILGNNEINVKENIVKQIMEANKKLIDELKPSLIDKGRMVASWFIPFPLSAALDIPLAIEEELRLQRFNWLFFIYDTLGKGADSI